MSRGGPFGIEGRSKEAGAGLIATKEGKDRGYFGQ